VAHRVNREYHVPKRLGRRHPQPLHRREGDALVGLHGVLAKGQPLVGDAQRAPVAEYALADREPHVVRAVLDAVVLSGRLARDPEDCPLGGPVDAPAELEPEVRDPAGPLVAAARARVRDLVPVEVPRRDPVRGDVLLLRAILPHRSQMTITGFQPSAEPSSSCCCMNSLLMARRSSSLRRTVRTAPFISGFA